MFNYSCLVVLLSSAFMVLSSCQSEQKSDKKEVKTPVFSFKKTQQQFKKASEGCQGDSSECASIEIDYTQFQENTPAFQRINDSILYYVKTTLSLEDSKISPLVSLEDLGNRFIQDYNEYTAEAKIRAEEDNSDPWITPWDIETTVQVNYESPQAVSLTMSNYAYTGGAHPNSNVTLLTYSSITGKPIKIKDLIKNRTKFNKLAEQKFRETNEIAPQDNLNDKGFFWDGKFQLPANIGLVPEGLYFFYNSYEIAAYAVGPTDFVLTWEELGDLVDVSTIK